MVRPAMARLVRLVHHATHLELIGPIFHLLGPVLVLLVGSEAVRPVSPMMVQLVESGAVQPVCQAMVWSVGFEVREPVGPEPAMVWSDRSGVVRLVEPAVD